MTVKLRLILSVVILIPQTVMFGLTYNSSFVADKYFNQVEAFLMPFE